MGKIPIALTAALLVCVGNAISVRNGHRPFMQTGTRSTFQAVPDLNQTELPDWVENDAESAPEIRAQQYETSDELDAKSFTSEILLGNYPDHWGYWKYF